MAGQIVGSAKRLKGVTDRIVYVSEVGVVAAAGVLVIISILVATALLYTLFVSRLGDALHSVGTIDQLQEGVEKVFAGVLLLMLGLELLKCLVTFFTGFEVQVEIILIVAIIAVARHIMLIDIEHADWKTLVGAAALVLALGAAYAMVRWRPRTPPAKAADQA
jgi:uncharacterized membrane protein (DUF373 family)